MIHTSAHNAEKAAIEAGYAEGRAVGKREGFVLGVLAAADLLEQKGFTEAAAELRAAEVLETEEGA